ncbi:GTP cyclohydrolase 1 type 2 [Buchnera aphidicola (Eriosoma grossulariae)]|uniref:Nif3-like dinuclear metal center hexameric protein n=1 Tax=Buchnera aphidicola TaxID=9 RepID=UPI003464C22B
MKNFVLEKIINQKLNSIKFKDCVPNGLQIEGSEDVLKIITGVTACQELLNYAVKHNAHGIIVHHGYFWETESKIIHGMKKNRLKTILLNNINLYSWHLPLDFHPELGNNIQIAKKLDIEVLGSLSKYMLWGKLRSSITGLELVEKITQVFGRIPFYCNDNTKKNISSIAWCSGKGQSLIYEAAAYNMDAFITGEMSEDTIHCARENGLHFFSIGHHASEKFGIQALNDWLKNQYKLDCTFIDINNFA